ncbi:MAG: DUF1178 family protein [Thauera sp.]
MIVLDLSCAKSHRFEGWFASSADFESQLAGGVLVCPVCGDTQIHRLPSAPYVQTRSDSSPVRPAASGAPAAESSPPAPTVSAATVAHFVSTLRQMARKAEDVGERLPEEARRIHYGDAEARDIRGAASQDEIEELLDEGIMVLPVPPDEDLH